MPSKKKKYNARFPAGRIKKIMQTDEEVGKVAQAVPIIISRTLELFVASLLNKTLRVTNARNAKTVSPSHMKQCIMSESRFDFLRELVKNIPDISVNEDGAMECTSPGQSNDNSVTSASSSPSTSRTFHNNPSNGNNNNHVIKYNGKHPTSTTTSMITPSSAPIIPSNEHFSFDMNKQIQPNLNRNYDRPTTSANNYDYKEQQQYHPLALNFYKEIPEISSVIQHTSNTHNISTTSFSFDEGMNNENSKYAKKFKRFDSAPSSYNMDNIETGRPFIKIDVIQKPNTPVINSNKITTPIGPTTSDITQPLFNIDLSKKDDYYQSCSIQPLSTDTKDITNTTINPSNAITRSLLKTNIIKRKAAVPKLAPIVKIDLSNSFQQPASSSPSISSSTSIDLSNKPISYSLSSESSSLTNELIPSPPIININVCNNTPTVKIDYSNLAMPPLSTISYNKNYYNNHHHINDILPSSSSTSSYSNINSSAPIINIDLSNITNTSNNNLINNNSPSTIATKNISSKLTTINSTLDMDEDYDNI